jgi:ketol-acid reductoisomerase
VYFLLWRSIDATDAGLQVVVGTTERVAASVQCEVERARRESGAAAAALARDAAVLAEDARTMRVWAKQLEHTMEEVSVFAAFLLVIL